MNDSFRSLAATFLLAVSICTGEVRAGTAEEVATAADAAIAAEMKRSGAPGAAIAVVAAGRVAFVKGYGFADLDAGVRVDGDTTTFRIGSITKIFTAVAVMQLVETGRLSLDGDVNAESGAVQVPDAFDAPVTPRNLLTHTAGFEETACGTRSRTVNDARRIADAIGDCVPPRMYPPGRIGVYTNFAFYLLGHLVEQTSGLGYHDYLDAHVLGPLGLRHTTSRQALPAALLSQEAVGYAVRDGLPVAQPFDVNDPPSAGGIGASAGDMAIFMQALVSGGGPILSAATLSEMQSVAFTQDARVGGIGLGFHIWSWRNPVVLGHGGQTKQFRAEMWLVPERGFAVFVVMNADTARPMNVARTLLERFAPNLSPAETQTLRPDPGRAAELAGPYRAARFGLYGPLRLMNVLRGIDIAFDDGRLLWRGARLTEREPNFFVSDDGATRVAVTTAEGVDGAFLVASDATVYPFFKRHWMDAPTTQYWIMGLSVAAILSLLAIWPFVVWAGRATAGRGRAFGLQGVLLLLAFVALAAALAIHANVGIDIYYFGVEGIQKVAFLLPVLAAGLLVAALVHLKRVTAMPGWARLHALGCIVTLALTLVFYAHWNLIGWWF